MSVIVPATNHTPAASQVRKQSVGSFHMTRSAQGSTAAKQGFFRTVLHMPSFHQRCHLDNHAACLTHPGWDWQITADCNICFCPANRGAECEPYLQRIVLLSRLLHLSLCCSRVRGAWCRGCQWCACVVNDCHECVLRVALSTTMRMQLDLDDPDGPSEEFLFEEDPWDGPPFS